MITNLSELKHGPAILQFFEMMCEPGMSPVEKIDFTNKILELANMTLEDLDNAMEQGVQNGHSVEEQLQSLRILIDALNGKWGL
jgi:hypothetical protein